MGIASRETRSVVGVSVGVGVRGGATAMALMANLVMEYAFSKSFEPVAFCREHLVHRCL